MQIEFSTSYIDVYLLLYRLKRLVVLKLSCSLILLASFVSSALTAMISVRLTSDMDLFFVMATLLQSPTAPLL